MHSKSDGHASLMRRGRTVNESRRLPWLSGLIAAIAIAGWLIYAVIADAVSVITGLIDATPIG